MQKVLLCRPHHFRVDYQINPWMKIGSVNPKKAYAQWENLVATYQKLGLEVNFIDQVEQFPDMVFAADQGITFDNSSVLLSQFKYPERQGESEFYQKWYQENGFKVVHLPLNHYFEGGGELQKWGNSVLIGTGFRTDPTTAQIVGQILNRKTLALELINPKFYHLDTCLFVVDQHTVFYYPPAFTNESIKMLRQNIPHLIAVMEQEIARFAANSTVVGSTVIMQPGSPGVMKQLNQLDFRVITVDISEFIKAGGGIHCLTGDLDGR